MQWLNKLILNFMMGELQIIIGLSSNVTYFLLQPLQSQTLALRIYSIPEQVVEDTYFGNFIPKNMFKAYILQWQCLLMTNTGINRVMTRIGM
jgi:hypothetical protein